MKGGDNNASLQEKLQRASAYGSPARALVKPSPASRLCWQAAGRVPYVMLCTNPYMHSNGQAFGCGQCLPCRTTKRRIWAHRMILEAAQYVDNTFVTLTYSDEKLPDNKSVSPRETQLWLKRLRKEIEPRKVRYFLVGEYGDETQRPHYHAALFGFPNCGWTRTRQRRSGTPCCDVCDLIHRTWGLGGISLGTLTPESAGYIAGYVTKKMTRQNDERLNGRHPEFARMSLRPGIGADALWEIADRLMEFAPSDVDVVTSLNHGRKSLPLGRYLTRKLRAYTGREVNAPPETLATMAAKVHHLREAAKEATKAPGMATHRNQAFKSLLITENKGRVAGMEARQRIYKQRRSQ